MESLDRSREHRRSAPAADGRRSDPDPDLSAVRAVAGGDLGAFETIVRRWQSPLINLAYRYCRDHARAEELAQDVFIKVFRTLGRYRGESRFSTWLFAVAINHYRTHARRRSPLRVPLDMIAEMRDPRTGQDIFEASDRDEIVRGAVASLPARYRDAVLLFYFFDMDLAAASNALGLPEGTVKARLHRGRHILRRKLARVMTPQPSAGRA